MSIFLKSEPYNAVDFDPSKDKEEDQSGYLLKYAGGISIYFKKKKRGSINIHLKSKKEYIYLETSAHPKHNNVPLIFTKSGIEFDHQRKIREINEENREIKGDGYRAEFKKAEFLANENLLSKDFLKFIIDESSEVRTVPEVNKDMITGKRISEYVEAFQTKRKDSNDYNEALKFLKEYFDDNNKKEIDL